MLTGWNDKSATAKCIFGYCDGTKNEQGVYEVKLFIGTKKGQIVEPRGSFDYAWDPCFQPEGFNVTYGEMDKSVKNSISHYKNAVDQIKEYFSKK